MRAAVDAFAARYAAMRVAAGLDKKPLLEAFARFQKAARQSDYHRVAQADRALHQAIV
jgi:DNA-binding GntR family transcriptional regulator